MTVKKHGSVVVTMVTLSVMAAMMLIGCSTDSPVAPTLTAAPSQPRVLSRGASPVSGSALGSPVNSYTESTIVASQGGRLQLYDVVLDIPAGALDNDTLYSISIPDLGVFYNEFGTDGLVFKKPVKVTMSYRDADLSGINESTIRIGWWDEDNGRWIDMNCQLDRVNQVVVGELNHFSAYALVSD
ncbi:MAG: hypothetical protein NTW07_06560 [candidate division Zixibacteria bacterium]|nr:hypothetical protein [candidate division Zixibacteria bacterium]